MAVLDTYSQYIQSLLKKYSPPANPNFSPLLSDTAKQCHTAIARMIL
jgi:hypothetical protein